MNNDSLLKILHAIYRSETDSPNCFFIDEHAQIRITSVYSTLLHAVRGNSDQSIYVASTGIVAAFLSGGRTVHNIFRIPLTLNATST